MIRLRKPTKPAPAPEPAEVEWWTVMGIDPSTTRMGLVVLKGAKGHEIETLHAGDTAHTDLVEHNRQRAQTGDIIDLLNKHRPDFVVIEGAVSHGIAGGASKAKILAQAGVVRYVVNSYGYDYRETTPSELKKFVAGSGTVKKPAMKAAVLKRWGYAAKNHDIAEAYGLAYMGLAAVGVVARLEQHEREILGNMKFQRAEA